ncbi:MAG: dienelactone hydrolase family protein [Deltaproteobacteria bacterium]|nr:dienelactone hydrolase family protein [Deltaproteobacteria bacterium]
MKTTVDITTRDGTCPAAVFRPDDQAKYPAVIVYMDGLGYGPPIEQIAERIAKHGYVVLAPDLFYRARPYERAHMSMFADPEKRKQWFEKMMVAASTDKVMSDMEAYLAYLDSRGDVAGTKVGITGYCMGGRLALAAAGHFPDRVAATTSYHPGNIATDAPDSPHKLADKIKAKVYVGGASEDPSFPEEQKQRLDEALTKAGVAHTIETYPAKHGWTMPDTPVYDAACAERHFETMLAAFDSVLRK